MRAADEHPPWLVGLHAHHCSARRILGVRSLGEGDRSDGVELPARGSHRRRVGSQLPYAAEGQPQRAVRRPSFRVRALS